MSKKVEIHACTVAIHFRHYKIRAGASDDPVTPAMVAGLTDRLCDVCGLETLVETAEEG